MIHSVIEIIAGPVDDGLIERWEKRVVGCHTVYEVECADWETVKQALGRYGLKEHHTSEPGARRIYDPMHESIGVYQPS